jgi:osmotically-inducible protein OsmY
MATAHSIFPSTQDQRIHEDVCRQLTWQTDIQSKEIVVDVKNSAVILSGQVETCLERREAESAAKAVYGVSSVTNNLKVEPKHARTDSEIAEDVIANLRMVICVLEAIPSVTVRDGVVTLEGRVRWNFQRESAERASDAVVGVLRVDNWIKVQPKETYALRRVNNRKRPETAPVVAAIPKQPPAGASLFFLPSVVGRA